MSPAIAIEHKTNINNSRSTVGTITEIYYYLTLLYEKIGQTFSPISGKEVKKASFKDFKEYIYSLEENTRFLISCEINSSQIKAFEKEGYSRIIVNGKIQAIDKKIKSKNNKTQLVIDRLHIDKSFESESILKEAYDKAIEIGQGEFSIYNSNVILTNTFNNRFFLDNIQFEIPNKDLLPSMR